jgi:DNA modification methylase
MEGVTLHLGDCLSVLPGLEAESVDAVVTDPPFKLSVEYAANVDADNLLSVAGFWGAASACLRVTKPGGLCVFFYDTRILPLAVEAMRRTGWRYLRALTFYRRWGRASMLAGWMATSDVLLVYCKPGRRPRFYGEAGHDVYTKSGPEDEITGHPAQKPVCHLEHLVNRVSPPGGTVLDPYTGSGSTGVACVRAGRRFIGVELNPAYFKAAEERLAGTMPGLTIDGPLFATSAGKGAE